jgi:hypothetical protein
MLSTGLGSPVVQASADSQKLAQAILSGHKARLTSPREQPRRYEEVEADKLKRLYPTNVLARRVAEHNTAGFSWHLSASQYIGTAATAPPWG